MFKIGEKVVFVDSGYAPPDNLFVLPQKNEIVTIHACSTAHPGCYKISEYLTRKDGTGQSFTPDNFRKLDHQYSENLLEEIIEKVKQGDLILN